MNLICDDCGSSNIKNGTCHDCGLEVDGYLRLTQNFKVFEELKPVQYSKFSKYTKKAIRLDKRIKYQIKRNYLLAGLLDVLAEIDISMVQKQLIVNHVRKLNPNDMKDVFDYFILTIIKFEFPITNKAMLGALKKYKLGKKAFGDFKYKQRDYSWYIWKLLSKIKFLSNEGTAEIYKIVKGRYDYVLSKTIGIDPTALIGCLCYHVIRKKYGNRNEKCYVGPKHRHMKFFNIYERIYNNYKKKGYLKLEK